MRNMGTEIGGWDEGLGQLGDEANHGPDDGGGEARIVPKLDRRYLREGGGMGG